MCFVLKSMFVFPIHHFPWNVWHSIEQFCEAKQICIQIQMPFDSRVRLLMYSFFHEIWLRGLLTMQAETTEISILNAYLNSQKLLRLLWRSVTIAMNVDSYCNGMLFFIQYFVFKLFTLWFYCRSFSSRNLRINLCNLILALSFCQIE